MADSSTAETGYLADLLKEEPAPDAKPEAAESSPAEGENPAPSPSADAEAGKPAEGAKAEPKSLLDAVQAAVKPPAQEQSPGSKTETEKQEAAKAEADKAKDQWDGKSPLHEHPRFKEVIAERNAFKEKATAFDQFVGAVAETGLSIQEYNQLLGVGALIKRDPGKALAEIEKVADQLRAIVGEKLSPELQKRVDDGEISLEDAREISRARARADLTEQRSRQTAEEAQAARRSAHLKACDEAATRWSEQQRAADPDWSKKEQLVREQAELLLHQYGPPPTVEDALKLMNVAKRRVEERLRSILPAKQKIEAPVRAGAASATHAPAPKTLEEAIQMGLRMSA